MGPVESSSSGGAHGGSRLAAAGRPRVTLHGDGGSLGAQSCCSSCAVPPPPRRTVEQWQE